MPIRTADATWQGPLEKGNGTVRIGSGGIEAQYSFNSRFAEGPGTNPEELIGAAEAGCYSMALAGDLGKAGYEPQRINTTAGVHINKNDDGWAIPQIDLRTEVEISGISESQLREIAEQTKDNCPVSRLLATANITLEVKLAG